MSSVCSGPGIVPTSSDKPDTGPVSGLILVPTTSSAALSRGGERLHIEHRGEIQRLQITHLGTLTLTG